MSRLLPDRFRCLKADMGIRLGVLVCSGLLWGPAPEASSRPLYRTTFSNPPFVPGSNTWSGTDGWSSNSTLLDGTESIVDLGGNNGAATLGFNPPSPVKTIIVSRDTNFDPTAGGFRYLRVRLQMAVTPSTNGSVDTFSIDFYGSRDWNSLYFSPNPVAGGRQSIGQAGPAGEPGQPPPPPPPIKNLEGTFPLSSFFTYELVIDYPGGNWRGRLDGETTFSETLEEAFSGLLQRIVFSWNIDNESQPGDNYLSVNNLTIESFRVHPDRIPVIKKKIKNLSNQLRKARGITNPATKLKTMKKLRQSIRLQKRLLV
ncbi:MAG: hypothetical protein KDN18_20975 [Verrucomicrobiae bacterium]|nr:hypothetical protein [Verrucomicrobiae bacterium]